MKKLLLSAMLLGGMAAAVYAQGFISLDNINNTSSSPTATSGGLFFLQTGTAAPTPIAADFNAAFYGGSDSANLTLLASFVGSGAAGDNAAGAGTFIDSSGKTYGIPGTTTSAFFMIQAWDGTATSYAAAVSAGAHAGQSGVFSNPVAVAPNTPPDLTGMPGIVLSSQSVIPEPSTFALAGLGAAALLILRKRK